MSWIKRWDIWGVLVGVIGIVVAAYAFYVTDKVGQISYNSDTQKVFDPTNLSGFSLVDSANATIKQTVYATDFVVWNSGGLSLSENSDRVREPLKISVDGTIHYFIVNKFNVVSAENFRSAIADDKRSLTISWRFFDPGQGIRLTIIHSRSDKLDVSGRFFETSLAKREVLDKADRNNQTKWVVPLITFVGSLGMIILVIITRFSRELPLAGRIVIAGGFVANLTISGFLLFSALFPTVPPI